MWYWIVSIPDLCNLITLNHVIIIYHNYDIASVSEMTPCSKIDKPLVVYRFSGNLMSSKTIINDKVITFFTLEMRLQSNLNVI